MLRYDSVDILNNRDYVFYGRHCEELGGVSVGDEAICWFSTNAFCTQTDCFGRSAKPTHSLAMTVKNIIPIL